MKLTFYLFFLSCLTCHPTFLFEAYSTFSLSHWPPLKPPPTPTFLLCADSIFCNLCAYLCSLVFSTRKKKCLLSVQTLQLLSALIFPSNPKILFFTPSLPSFLQSKHTLIPHIQLSGAQFKSDLNIYRVKSPTTNTYVFSTRLSAMESNPRALR